MTNLIQKNATVLIRLPNNSFWQEYDYERTRNLKTQRDFIQCIHDNTQYKVINDVPYELIFFAIVLKSIHTRFPPNEWFHIYTDGSLLDFSQGAGAGVLSDSFSFFLHVGIFTTHFDGELEAIHVVLQQLAVRFDTF
ncbi:uncharacterized protein NPIL_47221 [Nephila pilipes]|uniref:RNase H type-1 domain-containing protein n=1 Tax=Nephila pilipes TaxID=299642 RepID=A0A8X6TPV9_NEPPI|nr:uncharacterized protein NPIL_47221 [Nephila pilipes]